MPKYDKLDTKKEYENDILDVGIIQGTDLKINPDYYIHLTLVAINKAREEPDTRVSFRQLKKHVEALEIHIKAAKRLPGDYGENIKVFKESPQYKDEENEIIRDTRLIEYKELLLREVAYESKMNTDSILY